MATTSNYGGVLPTVGGDDNTWGDENNTIHELWDTTIKAVSDAQKLVLVTSGTVSGAASADIAVSGYRRYVLLARNIAPASDANLWIRTKHSGDGAYRT